MNYVPLIKATRGGFTESIHYGAVAVVDVRGSVVAHAGDPHLVTFTRSTLKALQALPFMQAGGAQALGFESRHVAMLCASHSGEDMHVAAVEEMLAKAGTTYKRLQCGCHVPGKYSYFDLPLPAGETFDERHHNCSGKHSGMLAFCAINDLSDANYIDPAHPLQHAIRAQVARAVRMDAQDLKMGIDGCSAPNYAMPLSALALGYARLASGSADAEFGEQFAQLSSAMTAHPELVSGTGREDAILMRAGGGDWVSKVGADGVQVIGSKSRGQAFALKISDGGKLARGTATVAVLDQLGWLTDAQRKALAPLQSADITNARGTQVGDRRAVFKLEYVK
jgi:L-asparaginase II